MSDAQLLQAQEERIDALLLADIDDRLDVLFSAADVSPEARAQLRALLKHYAKQAVSTLSSTNHNELSLTPMLAGHISNWASSTTGYTFPAATSIMTTTSTWPWPGKTSKQQLGLAN